MVTVGTRKNARKGIYVENVMTLTTTKAAKKGTPKDARNMHQKIADLEMIALIKPKSQQPTNDYEDLKVRLEQFKKKVLLAKTRRVLSLEEEVTDLRNKSILKGIQWLKIYFCVHFTY